MCCRAKVTKAIVTTLSVLAALGGLAIISFCFKLILGTNDIFGDSNVTVADKSQETSDLIPTGISPASDAARRDDGIDEIGRRVAIIAFSVGVSAVVFGMAGICTAKIQKCPCTFTYGLCSIALTIVYALAAAVLLSLYYVTDDQIRDFCNDDLNLDAANGILVKMVEEVEDYVYTVDKELKRAVNLHMCTDYCPCEGGWDYSIYGTSQGLIFADHANNDYNFSGTQTKFIDCIVERETLWPQQDPSYVPIDSAVVSLTRSFEEAYDCSGLCSSARFWVSRDIKNGPPTQSCIYTLKNSFDEDMVLLGWSIVATTIILFFLFCCHCGLYRVNAFKLGKNSNAKKRFIFD